MGMGYGANYADTVDEKFVKANTPTKVFNAFKKQLAKLEDEEVFDVRAIADATRDGATDLEQFEDVEVIKFVILFNKLCAEFKKNTGLDLYYDFHDADSEGDKYDDINGWFWGVNGMYQLTKAGKKNKNNVTRSFFVTFG